MKTFMRASVITAWISKYFCKQGVTIFDQNYLLFLIRYIYVTNTSLESFKSASNHRFKSTLWGTEMYNKMTKQSKVEMI